MKKLLSCLFLLTLVMAFASTASADLLYKEDFSYAPGGNKSANWTVQNAGNQVVINADYDALYFVAMNTAPGYGLSMMSNFSLNVIAGETYTVLMEVAGLAVAGKNLGLMIYDGVNPVHNSLDWKAVANSWNGTGDPTLATSLVEYTFVATAEMGNNIQLMFITDLPGSFVISSLEVHGRAVPIPGALFLLAPGVAGLAALKRRMK